MSNAIIPKSVTMSPPRHSIIPNDLWLKIFAFLLTLSPISNIGNVIDLSLFKVFWGMGPLFRLRKVSKTFANLAIIAFYEGNIFKFKAVTYGSSTNFFGNYIAPQLPPLALRSCLRRIQLTLFLSNSWNSLNVGADNSITAAYENITNQVESAKELFAVCPGARMLHTFSNSMTGLKVLDLHLIVNFRSDDYKAAIAVYRSAGFSVVAETINLKMTNTHGESKAWHAELAQAIGL